METTRRDFLTTLPIIASVASSVELFKPKERKVYSNYSNIEFAAIGLNHGHIYGMVNAIKRGGGKLKWVYAAEKDLVAAFIKSFPEAKVAVSENQILEDKDVKLVLSAAIPVDRAPLGERVMLSGKDYLVDKPGITSLDQLKKVRKTQKETGKKFTIMYSERLENRATVAAGELVKNGEIGKVIQTIGLGPHRMRPESRPPWFFDMQKVGGILTDIASHQFDQFLHFTESTKAKILSAQVKNYDNEEHRNFEDFGDAMVSGDKGTGYIRVDWFTPEGLDSWGDGRLIILGTEGYIEVRKNTDIASGRKGGNHLYLVNQKETKYFDCSNVELDFGPSYVQDILDRTEFAMTQEHCFKAMELALEAQALAWKSKK